MSLLPSQEEAMKKLAACSTLVKLRKTEIKASCGPIMDSAFFRIILALAGNKACFNAMREVKEMSRECRKNFPTGII